MPSDAKKRAKEKKKEAQKERDRPKKKLHTKSDEPKTENVGTVVSVNTAVETKDLGDTGNVVAQVHETTNGAEDLQQKKPQTKPDEQKPDDLEPVVIVNTTGEAQDIGDTVDVVSHVNKRRGVEAVKHECKCPDDLSKCLGQLLPELRNDNERHLLANCKSVKLKFHGSTPADGNCFFHAVADQLSMTGHSNQSAADLRQELVDFLRIHETLEGPDGVIDLKGMVTKDWRTYCNDMEKDKEWADAVVVFAMAHLLKKDIMVVISSPEATANDHFIQWIVGVTNFKGTPLLLGHVHESHYQSLQRDDDQQKSIPETDELRQQKNKPAEKDWKTTSSMSSRYFTPVAASKSPALSKMSNPGNLTHVSKGKKKEESQYEQKDQSSPCNMPLSTTQQELEARFKDQEYKNKQKADLCFYKVQVVLAHFVEEDFKKEKGHSSSTRDISDILNFISNCLKYKGPEFGGFYKSANMVRLDRNNFIHDYESEPKLPSKKLKDYINNMKNLLKNKKLQEAGKAVEALTFIQEVGSVDYVISLEGKLQAKISELEGQMKVMRSKSEEHEKQIAELKKMQGEIDELKRKLDEVQKDKDCEAKKPTEEELTNIQLLLIYAYRSIETISMSPIRETAENIKALEDFYTDVVIEEVDEKSLKRNKDKPQEDKKEVTSFRQIFGEGGTIKRVVLQAIAGCGKSTFCRKLVKSWSHVHGKRQNTVSGDGSANSTQDSANSTQDSADSTQDSANSTQDSGLKDENEMHRFDLLLYVSLKKVSPKNSLLDAFFNQFPLVEQQTGNHPYRSCFTYLIREAENKVLLILDGLDEMDTSDTFIEKIMQRTLYPSVTVLATTRPWKIEQLKLSKSVHMDLLLDLKGFNNYNSIMFAAKIFVRHYSLTDGSDIDDFVTDVSGNHMISSLKHIPLLMLFLVHVWHDNRSFPQTIHELYFEILNTMVKRYIEYKKEYKKIKQKQNGDCPDEKTQAQQKSGPLENEAIRGMSLVQHFGENFLNALCDVACQFLSEDHKKNSCVFKAETLVKLFGTDGESMLQTALELGLLSKSESPGVWDKETNVSFFHKTIQEFLVAISICCRGDRFNTFLNTLNTVDDVLENENIIMFTAGISTSQCGKISVKICKILDTDSQFRIHNSIYRLYKDCAREARGKDNWLKMQHLSAGSVEEWNVLYSALQSIDDVKYLRLRKFDMTSSKCQTRFDISQYTQLAEIDLIIVSMNGATMDFTSSTCLTKFSLRKATLTGKSKIILSKCNQLKSIFLRNITWENESELVLSECRHLKTIYVRNISNGDAICTLDLSESSSLICLRLFDFSVTSKCKLLMLMLPQLQTLELQNVRLENLNLESKCLTDLVLVDVTMTSDGKLVSPMLTQAKSIFAYNVVINNTTPDLSGSMCLTKVELDSVTMNNGSKLMLSGCPQLTHLKLKNLNLNYFLLDLTESSSLTELILLDITGRVKMMLFKCTPLRHVELNKVDLNDFELLVDSADTNLHCCKLFNLTISGVAIQNLLQYVNHQEVRLHDVNVGNATLDLPKCLKALSLRQVTMSSDKMTLLFESLSQCKHLESLKMHNLNLSNTLLKIDKLERLKSLDCFNLHNLGNTLDFSKCNSLEVLRLKNVTMSCNDEIALFEGMSHCKQLKSLDLYSLDLHITPLTIDKLERLKILSCYDVVNLGNTLDLSKCTCLKELHLYSVTMSDDRMALFEGMSHCKQLEILNLSSLDLTNTSLEMDMFKRLRIFLLSGIIFSSVCAARIQSDPEFSDIVKKQDSDKYILNDFEERCEAYTDSISYDPEDYEYNLDIEEFHLDMEENN